MELVIRMPHIQGFFLIISVQSFLKVCEYSAPNITSDLSLHPHHAMVL